MDSKIRYGDSLIGVSNLGQLAKGIPDAAYAVHDWDDKANASYYRALNKTQRDGGKNKQNQERFEFSSAPDELAEAAQLLDQMPDDNVEQIGKKAAVFASLHSGEVWTRLKSACDLWVSAFFMEKSGEVPKSAEFATVPTTDHVWLCLRGVPIKTKLLETARAAASNAQAFHWPLMFPDVFARGGFDVVLGNPPWDTMSPDVKEFFSPYDPEIRFLSPADQKARVQQLKAVTGVAEAWDLYSRSLYWAANFMKESGRYTMFAEGNLGKGDFNVYRMFVELALTSTKNGGRAAQFVPENLYNGANATAIRQHLFTKTRLERLVCFENTKRVWFDIHSAAKFCMYVAAPGGETTTFAAAFGINSLAKLSALSTGLPFDIPLSLVREFSPDTLAVAEIAHRSDIEVSRKIYAALPKFGAYETVDGERPYSTEFHMGNDRDDFAGKGEIPIIEGRMVEAYDYRAKRYVSGRGRSAKWEELAFGSDQKRLSPQWYISTEAVPEKLGTRWKHYRLGFCDVGGVTNQRYLVASFIPKDVVCGHSVPTVVFQPHDIRLMALWLGVTNSFALDYLARKKGALHLTFSIMDSLPLPIAYDPASNVHRAIAIKSMQLGAVGPEMDDLWKSGVRLLDIDVKTQCRAEDDAARSTLRSEIDVLVARDLFRLTKEEFHYLIDPSDFMKEECGFESFGALKRAEQREFNGEFRTRDRILKAWNMVVAQSQSPMPIVAAPRVPTA